MNLRTRISVLLCFIAALCMAQEENSDYNWEGMFSGELNSNGYGVNGGVHWMPIPYIGIGAAIGFDSEIKEISDWGRNKYDPCYVDNYCMRFIFKPSLMLRTPSLLHIKSQDMDLHLFASPGIIMSPPASGAKGSEWLYWTGSAGITAIIDRLTLSLGYSQSNYSLIDGNPYTHHGYDPYVRNKKNYTHSVFFTLGWKF